MTPTSDLFGSIIDCRVLIFQSYFFGIDTKKAMKLAEAFFEFVNTMFRESCVLSWKYNGKACHDYSSIANAKKTTDDNIVTSVLGDVKSDRICNKTTLRRYDRDLRSNPVFHLGLTPPFSSVDYPSYAKTFLGDTIDSQESLRNALIKTFSLEGQIYKSQFSSHDIEGYFISSSREETGLLNNGQILLQISCHSLGRDINSTAELLYNFGLDISEQFVNVNTTIRIGSDSKDYDRYYGTLITDCQDPRVESQMVERAKYLYLRNVGWTNIISPTVWSLMNSYEIGEEDTSLTIVTLAQGSVVLRPEHGIYETTLKELKTIKRKLYPVLFPGKTRFPLDWNYWRSKWENIAVLDEEIIVTNFSVVFQHNGKANEYFLLH